MLDQRIEICFAVSSAISQALRTLLEQKHLYQRVRVSFEDLADRFVKAEKNPSWKDAMTQRFNELHRAKWTPHGESRTWHPKADAPIGGVILFLVEHAKLYCRRCESVQPFNPTGEGSPMNETPWHPYADKETPKGWIQAFAIPFLCQGCKEDPEVFLIRREGHQLILCGRSPIATAVVPPDVPKPVQRFYSGAVLAHQSGQTLCGNFMLRTLIEQFARLVTGSTSPRADEVIDAYMETLPQDFRDRFRSMKELYGFLSADMHAAAGNPELFDQAAPDIVTHFEARRLFRLAIPSKGQID